MAEFIIPEFLQNKSTKDFMGMIKAELPADIDLSEGSHTWNFAYPAALVAAYLCEYVAPEVIRIILPEYSNGESLEGHAKSRSIQRRGATPASGELLITGEIGATIPAGSLFATASIDSAPSVDYKTMEDAVITESGTVTVEVQCTQAGTIGNTGPNTVIFVGSRLSSISAVTNPEDITGGTEEETDEALIERILDYDRAGAEAFTGSSADYKRWAMSVPGVGDATVISAQDDSGLVTIIITDSNGEPGSELLCEAVYDFIMAPDDDGVRLAPVNANLLVVPPTTTEIGIKATVEPKEGYTIEAISTAFLSAIALYLPEAMEVKEIKLTRVASVMSATEGVNDFKDLQIGAKVNGTITYGTNNITLTTNELPTVNNSDLLLTQGTV